MSEPMPMGEFAGRKIGACNIVPRAVEVLRFQSESQRAKVHFAALMRDAHAAGIDAQPSAKYRGHSHWLMLWGPGDPDRAGIVRRHVAAGGRAIVMDLAYWDRDRKIRVSIDAAHPQAWVMKREWSPTRFVDDRVPVANTWNPKGPVILAGIGRKARTQYTGDTVSTWEQQMIAACQARGLRVLYRKKQADAPTPNHVEMMGNGPIDQALKGASLVLTWHSNVAVDAIRMGIPVVCQDGAAAAVCPSYLPVDPQPLPVQVRDRFLYNLAWFQWHPAYEGVAMWTWLQELLS